MDNNVDFMAKWITTNNLESPIFRKIFAVNELNKAVLHVCGLGYQMIYINGTLISDRVLDPVYSNYEKRDLKNLAYPINDVFSYSTYYVTYDVSRFIKEGENCVAVILGNGWYNQKSRIVEGEMQYGLPKLLFQMEVRSNSLVQTIISDESWTYSASPIDSNSIFIGEVYDARLEQHGFSTTDFDDSGWDKAILAKQVETIMRPQLCPPNRIIENIKPTIIREESNYKLYDVGKNTTGWIKFTTSAKTGEEIIIRHSEEINNLALDFNSSGGIDQIQEDKYIADGSKCKEYSPSFTFHGFRYFEIYGECENVICQVIHTDIEEIGDFSCSSEILNWIVKAYKNSQLTNLQSGVPSDCPHRERLGYTGDGQITAESAMYFFDMESFYYKWLRDIADSQCKISGHIQHTAPFGGGGGGPGGWGCAIIILPWKLYLRYNNQNILEEYFDYMNKWMAYLESHSDKNIVIREEEGGWCLGDWCTPEKIQIDERLVNTYYYGICAKYMADISSVLNKNIEAEKYEDLYKNIQLSFRNEFYNIDSKLYGKGIQGAFAFADDLGVTTEEDINSLVNYYSDNPHFDTGIFGTPILCEVLFKHGYVDLVMELLDRDDFPSYGYWKKLGATTLWENWDGKDSHNHPMFGAVTGLMMKYLAGIHIYREEVTIKPLFPKSIEHVYGTTKTSKGKYSVQWEKSNGNIKISISTPVNTKTKIILPNNEEFVYGGEHELYYREVF